MPATKTAAAWPASSGLSLPEASAATARKVASDGHFPLLTATRKVAGEPAVRPQQLPRSAGLSCLRPTQVTASQNGWARHAAAQLAKLLDTAPRTVGAGGRADGKVGGREYYAFVPQLGWRFLILDPYQESIIGYPPNDQRRKKAEALVVSRNPNVDPVNPAANGNWLAGMARGDPDRRFVPYNGGIHHCPYPLRKAQSCVAPGLSS